MLVDPHLDTWSLFAGAFEQIEENSLILAKQIPSEPQSMNARNLKIDIERRLIVSHKLVWGRSGLHRRSEVFAKSFDQSTNFCASYQGFQARN